VALATSAEQLHWQRVMRVKDAAEQKATSEPESAETLDKIRLMKGVLYWNMSASFKARLGREQKEVRELAVATKEARRRYTLVGRARDTVPLRNEELLKRVKDLTPRLQAMLGRCLDTDQLQSDYLAKVATTQLQQQKDRLSQYTLQAQYALASIYDRAADAQRPTSKVPKAADSEEPTTGAATPDAAAEEQAPVDTNNDIDLGTESPRAEEASPGTDQPAPTPGAPQ
jgi:hypothetical protein